jgi:hypothetical protein
MDRATLQRELTGDMDQVLGAPWLLIRQAQRDRATACRQVFQAHGEVVDLVLAAMPERQGEAATPVDEVLVLVAWLRQTGGVTWRQALVAATTLLLWVAQQIPTPAPAVPPRLPEHAAWGRQALATALEEEFVSFPSVNWGNVLALVLAVLRLLGGA